MLTEAYAVQEEVVKSFNYNQIGWKVGCTTEMAQKFSGMTEPFFWNYVSRNNFFKS